VANLRPNCNGVAVGQMCEADGECGTDSNAGNCAVTQWSSRGGLDVYRRENCRETTPSPPPTMPSPPLPWCNTLSCDAGSSCGICLQKLDPANNVGDACPHGWESDWRMHTCDLVAPGELCEADGECSTQEINNCAGRDNAPSPPGPRPTGGTGKGTGAGNGSGPQNADVYRRIPCAEPPPPPAAPAPPPVPCDSCDAGGACGVCLQVIRDNRQCPTAFHSDFELPTCDIALKGQMCEGDGECGTTNDLNNCRGSDGETAAGQSWRHRNADVYKVLDCGVAPPYTPPGVLASPSPPYHGQHAAQSARTPSSGGDSGVNGGIVAFLCLLMFGLGGVAVVGYQRYGSHNPLTQPRMVLNTIGPLPGAISTSRDGSMNTPLASAAAPIGTGSVVISADSANSTA